MSNGCPNKDCKFHQKNCFVIKSGWFFREDDSRWVQRYKCKRCKKRFSTSTLLPTYRQKKRRKNVMIRHMLCSKMCMRRIAIVLNLNRITIARRLEFLAKQAEAKHCDFLNSLRKCPIVHLQFDDLITSEHTKLKPLTVSVAVDAKTRAILGAEVNQIGAFGHLASFSRKKYGRRKNHHRKGLEDLFVKIQKSVSPEAEIRSDEHKRYKPVVQKYLPNAKYKQYKSEEARDDGQGELKKKKYDSLFYINHTLGTLRGNINRLIRRTWSTTKRADRLAMHIAIFIDYHNSTLI